MSASTRALGAAGGLALDRVFGEPPPRIHPVAAFGRGAGWLEGHLWRPERRAGILHASIAIGASALAGAAMRRTAAAVAIAAAGRELRRTARGIAVELDRGDIVAARAALPSLVGRDPSELDASGVAAAVIESLAENSVDAVFAPALWGAVAGAPGALGYRAVNTLDAMVGHHNERYEQFGWFAARLDDVANLVPARVFAATVWGIVPRRRRAIAAAVRFDAGAHPSPNAGVAEAAVAGALGCSLGGRLRYGDRVEDRPILGRGPRPVPDDIAAAIALVDRAEWTLTAALAATSVALGLARRRRIGAT